VDIDDSFLPQFIFMLQYSCCLSRVYKLNSMALVREQTIPIERPPPVDEVSANFCG